MGYGKTKEELAKISEKTRFKTGSEQVKIARLGGIASGKAKRERKTIREELEFLLEKKLKNNKGEDISTREAISTAMIGQAIKGNVKAFVAIRDTIGEKPTEKTQTELTLTQALVEFVDGQSDDKDSGEVPPAVN
nr:MAG TPA: hypothetical protein [Caudoviricetes sp.]